MPDIERIVKELSRQKMTPEFKAQIDRQMQRGYADTIRGIEAIASINSQLTVEENRLADLFEQSLGPDGEPTCNTLGAREAFEKRNSLLEAAIPARKSDGSQI